MTYGGTSTRRESCLLLGLAIAASGLYACGGGSSPQPPTLAPPVASEPTPRSPGSFPDTDPAWLRALAADYPYAHEVGNVRVLSDISPAFSVQHAEHLRLVWLYFDQLYARNRGESDLRFTSRSGMSTNATPITTGQKRASALVS